jgi:hypothetical protein
VLYRAPVAIAIGDPVRVAFEETRDPVSGVTLRIPQWVAIEA